MPSFRTLTTRYFVGICRESDAACRDDQNWYYAAVDGRTGSELDPADLRPPEREPKGPCAVLVSESCLRQGERG